MCNSCGVSSSAVSGFLRRARSPVARSSRRARLANPSAPIADSALVRAPQLRAGLQPLSLATQPLAVEQLRPAEL